MRYLIVDHYRVRTGLPWLPGGVAVVSASEPPVSRYVADDLAQDASIRFKVMLEMIWELLGSGMPIEEVLTRAGRSGFSGYLSWAVFLRLDANAPSLAALFNHYCVEGSQALPSGVSELEPLLLPFG